MQNIIRCRIKLFYYVCWLNSSNSDIVSNEPAKVFISCSHAHIYDHDTSHGLPLKLCSGGRQGAVATPKNTIKDKKVFTWRKHF